MKKKPVTFVVPKSMSQLMDIANEMEMNANLYLNRQRAAAKNGWEEFYKANPSASRDAKYSYFEGMVTVIKE